MNVYAEEYAVLLEDGRIRVDFPGTTVPSFYYDSTNSFNGDYFMSRDSMFKKDSGKWTKMFSFNDLPLSTSYRGYSGTSGPPGPSKFYNTNDIVFFRGVPVYGVNTWDKSTHIDVATGSVYFYNAFRGLLVKDDSYTINMGALNG